MADSDVTSKSDAQNKAPMKLFFWGSPYPVGYGQSLVFAVAETEVQAREQVKKAKRYMYCSPLAENTGGYLPDDLAPLRVIDLPCAEFHEWSE